MTIGTYTQPLTIPDLCDLLTTIHTTTTLQDKLACFEGVNLTLVSNVSDANHSAVHLLYQACQILHVDASPEKHRRFVELIHTSGTTLDKSLMVEIMNGFNTISASC